MTTAEATYGLQAVTLSSGRTIRARAYDNVMAREFIGDSVYFIMEGEGEEGPLYLRRKPEFRKEFIVTPDVLTSDEVAELIDNSETLFAAAESRPADKVAAVLAALRSLCELYGLDPESFLVVDVLQHAVEKVQAMPLDDEAVEQGLCALPLLALALNGEFELASLIVAELDGVEELANTGAVDLRQNNPVIAEAVEAARQALRPNSRGAA